MNKELTICFRTSKDIKHSLGTMARRKRQTLSSVIEDILYYYLKENKAFKRPRQERRTFTRRKVALPAFIYDDDKNKDSELEIGTIMDISLCGLLISVPKGAKLDISDDGKNHGLRIVFTLPEFQRPINMICQPQRLTESEEAVQIGAAFVDSDFQSYRILQKYLI